MASQQVNISYFFRHPNGFPWDDLDLSRPYAAPLHFYMCEAAALYSDPNIRYLLKGKPALFEIKRFGEEHEIFKEIADYCRQVEDPKCRFTKAKLVIIWLKSQRGFLAYMQGRLDRLYRQGIILLPEGAQPQEPV